MQKCNIAQVSGIILMVCAKIAASRDPHLYPGGKSRAGVIRTRHLVLSPHFCFVRGACIGLHRLTFCLEPVGIVVFSAVMGMVGCIHGGDGDGDAAVSSHTSHVTRHTSHGTRHTSHVTRYTSHVTRHTSHVTRYTLHVTRYTSHEIGRAHV